jgi:undecaprenyl-diphosphatase
MNERVGLGARIQSLDETITSPVTIPRARKGALAAALAFAHSGDSYIWGALMVAAWFLGDHAWKVRAVAGVIGLVLVEVVVIGLKMIIRRPRPPGESGRIYRRSDPFSFPSGHAARAALLCILAWKLGPLAAAVVISAWSPVMVASRVAVGIHYVLDIAAGIMLGACLTAILLRLLPLIVERV